MSRVVFLDAGPLGLASHPRSAKDIVAWITQLLHAGSRVAVPEITDYEVRRELLRAKKTKGIERLDYLKRRTMYVPITTAAMLRAAELWAHARTQGVPTFHHHALDADVILAAQALTYDANGRDIVVASDNVSHLSRFVPAQPWQTIS